MEGIEQPSQVNEDALQKLKTKKEKPMSADEFLAGILAGNPTILSKAITLVESSLHSHQEKAGEIIKYCMVYLASQARQEAIGNRQYDNSIRIGITGVPGVGKSTFIEALGKYLTGRGHKLAVLAIDPSSTLSKGSILGDKTRMEELAVDPNAFIRPSPSAGSLGGVARKTRETIVLCEAAGFDVIFVETVGVGQSETAVHSMVDFFLLLMLAGAGDELQGIKRGIIEMADAIIINKADGDNIAKARAAQVEYRNALQLYPPSPSGWAPVVDTCSSTSRFGIDQVWETIKKYRQTTLDNGYFIKKRAEQNRQVLHDTIGEALANHFYSNKEIHQQVKKMEKEIVAGQLNPYAAAQMLLDKYFEK